MMPPRWRLFAILLLGQLLHDTHAATISTPFQRAFASKDAADRLKTNPFENEDDAKSLGEILVPGVTALMTACYGTSLVLFSHHCPGQIHCLTMFRATGQSKLESAFRAWKQNLRDARFAALRRAPALLMAKRTLLNLDDRIASERKLLQVTKKARADGIVTRREAKHIAKLKKQNIRRMKRDMRRMARATLSIFPVVKALDLREVIELYQSFLFQLLAVLATGHEDSRIGAILARWCLFLNLGSLVFDTNKKLGFPISSCIRGFLESSKPKADAIEGTGRVMVVGTIGYLVLAKNVFARRLNAALLSAAVVLRGLRGLIRTMISWSDDDYDETWRAVGRLLDGSMGGVLIVTIAISGLVARNLAEKGKLSPPGWLLGPLSTVEKAIERFALAAENLV